MGRGGKALAMRRAGYWLELIAQLGGSRFRAYRQDLLDEARRLRERLDGMEPVEPLRAGDPRLRETMDDLARKWGLAPGADIRRFRQLTHTGVV